MDEEIEFYGDTGIASKEGTVPAWLKVLIVLLLVWGAAWLYFFWNGSAGWIDRGYWHQLEQAANTTTPWRDADDPAMKE